MKVRYDIEKMKRIITDLCILTGITMSFLDTDRKLLFGYERAGCFCSALQKNEENRARCLSSDEIILDRCFVSKRFEGHVCHAGLFDAAMPIIKDGIFAGIILMGRVRLAGREAPADKLYRELPEFTEEKIQSLRTLLPNVLFESAIFIEFEDRANEIAAFIGNHLSDPLSIKEICQKFLLSKNTLYALFRESFGVTVIEYVTARRMEKAKELLRDTKIPMYEIAERVGIRNATYFCRLFKKKVGISATEYRQKPPICTRCPQCP